MRVVLIGDSIRLNAERHVRAYLADRSSVLSPSVNCGSSREIAKNIQDWAPVVAGDLVHINCGLHDIRHDPGAEGPVCTLGEYGRNLDHIFQFLSAQGVTVVWATSTPFLEHVHNSTKASRRFERQLIEYNGISRSLAKKHGVLVNDLYNKLASRDLRQLLLPDGLHFNWRGNALIGKLIAEVLASLLADHDFGSSNIPVRATDCTGMP